MTTQQTHQMLDDMALETVAGGRPTPWGPRPDRDTQTRADARPQQGDGFGEAFHPIYVGPCPNPDANG